MSHQLIIMLQCLPKTKTRIEYNVFQTQFTKLLHLTGKIHEHFLHQIIIMGFFLHILGSSLHVHHDIRHSQAGHSLKHPVVHLTGSDIIDDSYAILLHTLFGYIRPESIDRNDSIRMIPVYDLQSGT